jgi:hypothetical protein
MIERGQQYIIHLNEVCGRQNVIVGGVIEQFAHLEDVSRLLKQLGNVFLF